jgi:hypothetical protein
MQARFDKMKANLEYCIELQKKEFKEHFEGQIKSAKVLTLLALLLQKFKY